MKPTIRGVLFIFKLSNPAELGQFKPLCAMQKQLFALVFISMLGMSPLTNAGEYGEELQELAPRLKIPPIPTKQPDICSELITDINKWQNVQIIKPIVITETLDDPEIKKQFGACSVDKLITTHILEPNVWFQMKQDGVDPDSLSPEQWDEYGRTYVMTKSFRLYRANIRNDPSGVSDLVIYGADNIARNSNDYYHASFFNDLDIHECEISSSAQVSDTYRNPDSFVGLIQDHNRIYVFDSVHYPDKSQTTLTLQQWAYSKKTKTKYFSPVCYFEAKDK